jgi:hypothetical protein
LIDFDDLFEESRPQLTPEQEEEYRQLTEQWELESSFAHVEASNDGTIKF